jgi:hypothetical protein
VHSGRRRHAGCEIFSGKRMLLVGFIDEVNAEVNTNDGAELSGVAQAPLELHFQDHSS